MYRIYADESGDSGLPGDTQYFVISGLIIHETVWNETFTRLLDLRQNLSRRYNIPQRLPFHAYDIVNGHGGYHHSQFGVKRPQRFQFYKEILEFISQLSDIRILNIFIRKNRISDTTTIDLFEWAWTLFIQRFHNFLDRGGNLGREDDFGLLFTDRTHDDFLRRLLRKMRAFNYIPSQIPGHPSRRILVTKILDDPIPRKSEHSYFVQIADLVAYSLGRRDYIRRSLSKFNFESYFDILEPVLLKEATRYDVDGIVYWPR